MQYSLGDDDDDDKNNNSVSKLIDENVITPRL